ncbi:MAG: hypothetical protein WB565_15100 [Acidimicrobiales bacterium]
MSAGRADSGAEPAPSRRWIPFWVLQVAELAVAFVFVDVAVHLTSQGLLLAAAALFALLAVTARGPLGIVRLCPRRLHVVSVVVASVAIALSPILPVLRPDLVGIIVIEFGAVGMIRLATLTRTAEAAPVASPSSGSTSSAPTSSASTSSASAEPAETGAATGGQEAEPSMVDKSARTAAAAAVAGRQAVERYRPAAEEQARRALRGAGRSVGRVLRRASPPTEPPS